MAISDLFKGAVIISDWTEGADGSRNMDLLAFFTVAACHGHSVLVASRKPIYPTQNVGLYVQVGANDSSNTLTGWAEILGFKEAYLSALTPASGHSTSHPDLSLRKPAPGEAS